MKLTHNCPRCGKPAKIQSQFNYGKYINFVYQCGHIELKERLAYASEISKELNETLESKLDEIKESKPTNIAVEDGDELETWYSKWENEGGSQIQGKYLDPSYFSIDRSKHAYDYQVTGIKFAESTQLRCLIADAMGVGKTIQALIALKRNKVICFPCLIIVKGATLFQWAHEYHTWLDNNFNSCVPVTNRMHLVPGFDSYIISMDLFKKKDVQEKLLALNLKMVICDEIQNFKDESSDRTKALLNLIKLGKIEYFIGLSGTPIKNYADEYFVPLNIIAPSLFYSKKEFCDRWLIPNDKGRYTRINPYRLDQFKELISNFVIRREKHEVLTNLPSLTRDYQIIEIDDKNLRNSYNHTLDLFKNFLQNNAKIQSSEILGWLARLRAITGQAKCKNAIEWTRDFIESTDESIAIGIQHHSVRDTLYYIFEQFGMSPLKFSGEDSVYAKADIVRRFMRGDNRILVINSLAGGVGLNLQNCANALVIERQWNSADEEQFESRFHRDGQQKAVTITYMIAKGTIDEFFHDLVLKKKKILVETGIGVNWDLSSDIESLRNFADMIVNHKI